MQIYTEAAKKILQNKRKIESKLGIKISIKNNIVSTKGEAENDFLATEVIDAINLGFKVDTALMITIEGFGFEKVGIKDVTRRKDIARIRGRVIGTHGKALDTLESLTDCFLSVHDSEIGIIGRIDDLELAVGALKKLIQGSGHSKVYGSLERQITERKAMLQ